MQLQWVDLLIIAVVGLSALTGLFRGAVKEIIALCVWILAIWMGYKHGHNLDPWLKPYIQEESVRTGVGFILILFGVLFAGGIINTILSFMLRRTGLSGVDKILGMVFGFTRGVFIVALIMATVKMTSLPYEKYTKESKIYAQIEPVVTWISGYFPIFIEHVKAVDKVGNVIDTVPQL